MTSCHLRDCKEDERAAPALQAGPAAKEGRVARAKEPPQSRQCRRSWMQEAAANAAAAIHMGQVAAVMALAAFVLLQLASCQIRPCLRGSLVGFGVMPPGSSSGSPTAQVAVPQVHG